MTSPLSVPPADPAGNLRVKAFFHPQSSTLSYVLYDSVSNDGVIIDGAVDYDPDSTKANFSNVDEIVAFVKALAINIRAILETHIHADHLSAALHLKRNFFPLAPIAISTRAVAVQHLYHTDDRVTTPMLIGAVNPNTSTSWAPASIGSSIFDILLDDNSTFSAGSLRLKVIPTPGHTPACSSYYFEEAGLLFTGDALFMPDFGTGRCDFPGGSAEALYNSIHNVLYSLPDATRVFVGHDYQPGGRGLAYETTIGESKAKSAHIKASTTKDEFVAFRTGRDASLPPPKLLLPSLRANLVGGARPCPCPQSQECACENSR